MKTLPASPVRLVAAIFAVAVFLTIQATAQPSSGLPSSYTYMGAPPPGYPASMPAPASSQRRTSSMSSARPSVSRTTTTMPPHGYGPMPDNQTVTLAQLAANDQQQDSRIRKLERDVSSLKSSTGIRFVSTGGSDTAAASLRPHTSYVVRPGDSLWRIASAHRVAPGEIMTLNRMKSDTVMIGQTLMIPAPHGSGGQATTQATFKPYYHDVRQGDTSSTIAKKYNISRSALMAANPRVDFGGGLVPGSRVIIPGRSIPVSSPKTVAGSSSPASGTYIVKSGDSLKAIAIKHGTTTANLAELNGIKDANKLIVGQRLVLPGGKTSATASTRPKLPPKSMPPTPAPSDTVPLPGVGLPSAPPPVADAAKSAPPAPKPPSNDSESSRGVLAYRVDATDTLESIANQFSTTPARIREMNHLQPTTKLNSGDEIMVPAMGAVAVGR